MRPIDADAMVERYNLKNTTTAETLMNPETARAFEKYCIIADAVEKEPILNVVPIVFINDPFHVVFQAFKELYPNAECEIMFDYNVETTDTHEKVKGVTIFPDDGSIPQVWIDCEQTIDQISEILAHELAHVACGKPEWDDPELDHGEDFEKAFDAIYKRFCELQGFPDEDDQKEGE